MKFIIKILLFPFIMVNTFIIAQTMGVYTLSTPSDYTSMGYSCITQYGSNFLVAGTVYFPTGGNKIILTEILSTTQVVPGTNDKLIQVGSSSLTPFVKDILIDGDDVLICGYLGGGANIQGFVLSYNYISGIINWRHIESSTINTIFLDLLLLNDGDYLVCGERKADATTNEDAVLYKIDGVSSTFSVLHSSYISEDPLSDTYNSISVSGKKLLLMGRFHYSLTANYYSRMRPTLRICNEDGNSCNSYYYFQDLTTNARLYPSDMILDGKSSIYIITSGDLSYTSSNNLYEDIMVSKLGSKTGGIFWQNRYDITDGIIDPNFDGALHSIRPVGFGLSNSGTIVMGSEATSGNGSLANSYLIRLKTDGTVSWAKKYPIKQLDQANFKRQAICVSGDFIYLVGQEDASDPNGNGKVDAMIISVPESTGHIGFNDCEDSLSITVIDASYKADAAVLTINPTITTSFPAVSTSDITVSRENHNCILTIREGAVGSKYEILNISPNPISNYFIINAFMNDTTSSNATVSIINLEGKILLSKNITINNGVVYAEVQLQEKLTEGLYLIELSTDSSTITKKIIAFNK